MVRKGKKDGKKPDVDEEDRVSAVNCYIVHHNFIVEH